MPKKCPNQSHPDWKMMVDLLGEDAAWKLYDDNNQEIPTREQIYEEYNKNDIIKKSIPQNITEEILEPESPVGKLIFDRLQKKFPDIRIFSDRESFVDYVRKNGGDTNEIDWNSLGDAFASAIYIDPDGPVQETIFHEYAHIYWDALSDSHPIKKALRELYKDTGMTAAEIDENIISDIGAGGVDLAESHLDKSLINKFNDLLTKFWKAIKEFFGKYEDVNLVNQMVESIWNNLDNISEQDFTTTVVHHMSKQDDLKYDDKTHTVRFGNKVLQTMSSIVNSVSAQPFNPDGEANKIFDRKVAENIDAREKRIKEISERQRYIIDKDQRAIEKEKLKNLRARTPDNPDTRRRYVDMIKRKWDKQNSVTLSINHIADGIVKGLSKSQINDQIINKKGEKISDLIPEESYNIIEEKITNFIESQRKAGWEVKSNVLIGSKRYMASGHASLVLTKDDKAVIVDLRPLERTDEYYENKKLTKYFKSPIDGVEDTHDNQWKYQLGVFANIFEEQNNIDVVQVMTIPLSYDLSKGQALNIDVDNEKRTTTNRKRRNQKIKDRHRENSKKILNHSLLMQKVRTAQTVNEDLIEELNKKFGYDKDLLREVNIAMDVLSMHSGERLSNISEAYISNLFGIGLETMGDTLIDKLGFTREDIVGDKENNIEPMSAEEIIIRFRNDIKKGEEWKSEIRDFGTFKKRVMSKVAPEEFGVRTEEDAYDKYQEEMQVLNSIYARLENIYGIKKLSMNKIKVLHRSILNFGSEEALSLRQFFEDVMLAKILTERIRYENQNTDVYNKTATRIAYKMLVNPSNLFNDFVSKSKKISNLTRTMKNVGSEHMVIQLLNQELTSSHHDIISKTVVVRETLESFVKDEYYDSDKPQNQKKALKNEDFDAIIKTKKKGKIKYLSTPNEARRILEKKYGKDDPRPKNMAGYIAYLTDEMAEYDWYVKQAMLEYNEQPELIAPESYIRSNELYDMLNGFNKWYTLKLHSALAPSSVDNKEILIDGKKIVYLEYKKQLAAEILERNDNNESISDLVDKAKKAKEIAMIGEKKGAKIIRKNVSGGKQIGRAVILSKDWNGSIQENVASLISARHRESMIPLGEYVKSKYKGKQIAEDYLDKLVSKHIYQNFEGKSVDINWLQSGLKFIFALAAKKGLAFNVKSNLANRFFGMAGNWVMHPKTMMKSYERKFASLKGKMGSSIEMGRKIANMMEHARIGTVMQDFKFSKYKEQLKKLNDASFAFLQWAEFHNQGELFLGLLTDEEINAYNENGKPLMVDKDGNVFDPDDRPENMTFKEFQAWESKIKNSKEHPNALSKERITYIEARLNEVHGYFGFNKPAWSYYELGQWIGLYRLSWMQSIFNMWGMSRRADITGVERVGITRSYGLVIKSLMFNYLKTYRDKAIKNVKDTIESNSYFYNENRGTAFEEARKVVLQEDKFARAKEGEDIIYEGEKNGEHVYRINRLNYDFSHFDKIVQKKIEGEEEKITFKGDQADIGRLDLNNLVRGIILMTTYGLVYAFYNAIGDWDDDMIYGEEVKINGKKTRPANRRKAIYELTRKERLKHYTYQFLMGMGENITDDLILPINPTKLLELTKDPLVPVRLLEDMVKFIGNFGKWMFGMEGARYDAPNVRNKYDAVKWLYNIADVTVLDNAVSQLRALKRVAFDDPYYESIERMWDNNKQKAIKERMAQAYVYYQREGLTDKEIKPLLEEQEKMINKVMETPEYKEQFVMKVLKDAKQQQKILDSEDKQIQEMIRMINTIDASKKYFEEEAKKGKGTDINKSKIKAAEKKLDEAFDKI